MKLRQQQLEEMQAMIYILQGPQNGVFVVQDYCDVTISGYRVIVPNTKRSDLEIWAPP